MLSFVSVAVAAEVGLRLWLWLDEKEPKTVPQGQLMEKDPLVGWRPRSGFREQRRNPAGKPFTLRVNAMGMRGGEIGDLPSGQRRILVLGDSFTMATDFSEEETFVGQMSRILQESASPRVEIINGGVDGYGTSNELNYYHYYGRAVNPDIVMLCFYVGNDLRDNMISSDYGRRLDPMVHANPFKYQDEPAIPQVLEYRGEHVTDPLSGMPVPRPRWTWFEIVENRSLLARIIGSRLTLLKGRWEDDLAILGLGNLYYFFEFGFYQGRDDGVFGTAREFALDCLRELHRLVRNDGAELIIVVIPSDIQLDTSLWNNTVLELGLSAERLGSVDKQYVNRFLAEFCSSEGLRMLDLSDAFNSSPAPIDLYASSRGNRHLSAAGHRLAGAAMAEFLVERSSHLTDPAVDSYHSAQSHALKVKRTDAKDSVLRGIKQNWEWPALYFALGELYGQDGRHAEAIDAFQTVLRLDFTRSDVHGVLGDLFMAVNDTSEALNAYETTIRLRPSSLLARVKINHLRSLRGMEAEARVGSESLDEFLAFGWSSAQRINIARSFFAAAANARDAHLANRFLVRAADTFERGLESGTQDVITLNNLGSVYMLTDRDTEAASLFEHVTELDPSLPTPHFNLGIIYSRTGHIRRSLEHFRRAAELAPDADTYFELGNVYTKVDSLDEAAEAFRQAVRLEPAALKYLYNLGSVLATLGERARAARDATLSRTLWAESHRVLSELVRIDPGYERAVLKLRKLEQELE